MSETSTVKQNHRLPCVYVWVQDTAQHIMKHFEETSRRRRRKLSHDSLDAGDEMAIRCTTRKLAAKDVVEFFHNGSWFGDSLLHLDLCQVPCWLGNPFRLGQQNLIPQQVFEKKMTCGCHRLEASNMFLETDLTVNSYSDQGGWSTWWVPWWVDTLLPRWM